jgi:hypothetical protein
MATGNWCQHLRADKTDSSGRQYWQWTTDTSVACTSHIEEKRASSDSKWIPKYTPFELISNMDLPHGQRKQQLRYHDATRASPSASADAPMHRAIRTAAPSSADRVAPSLAYHPSVSCGVVFLGKLAP